MKKYTAFALALALCASLLVGCGCTGNVEVTTEPTMAPTTAPTTTPSTAPSTEPATRPTTAPDTTPAQPGDGNMDGSTGNGGNGGNGDNGGNMDTDRGSVPDASTNGARGRNSH